MGRVEGFLWLSNSLAKDPAFLLLPELGRCWEGAKAAGAALAGVIVLRRNIPGVGPGREIALADPMETCPNLAGF